MVDQQRPQRASVHQSKYDKYAKPVLLSQPVPQERPRLLLSTSDQETGVLPEQSARKPTPGKLNLDKIRSFSQDEWTATPGQDPMTGSQAARQAPENSGFGLLLDSTRKENLLSPGRLDLPNGTPLSRHPSDAHSRRTSPKALPDVAVAQGQITIVAEVSLAASAFVQPPCEAITATALDAILVQYVSDDGAPLHLTTWRLVHEFSKPLQLWSGCGTVRAEDSAGPAAEEGKIQQQFDSGRFPSR